MKFTLAEILAATGGTLYRGNVESTAQEEIIFSSVSTDTRTIGAGELFVALKGEKFDGADYAPKAVASGAAGVIVRADTAAEKTADLPCVIKVADTLIAYQQIARAYREKFNIPVLAITGSNGKTTTKDLTAAVLSSALNTLKTEANFNNEIGLPLTLLKLQPEHQAAVVEMGMRGLGQIAALAAIARPTIGIVTNVGETHIELLGSIDNIARAKGELIEALPADGIAILNADDSRVLAMRDKVKAGAKIITYGIDNAADVRASAIGGEGFATRFKVAFSTDTANEYEVFLPLAGIHNVYDALAALAAGMALNLPLAPLIDALADFRATGARFETSEKNGWLIVNDAYNASPLSMAASLDALKAIAGSKRRIATLGDMLELGEVAQAAHEKVGQRVYETGIDFLITRGELARHIAAGATAAGMDAAKIFIAPSHAAAAEKLKEIHRDGDVALFKGSHGMKMGEIIDLL